MDSLPVKTCTKCKVEKPATKEYFHKDSTCQSGWDYSCKMCVNAANKLKNSLKNTASKDQDLSDIKSYGYVFKVCTVCKTKLPGTLDFFYFSKNCKHSLTPHCKACHRVQAQRWRIANPEKATARGRAWERANPEKRKASCKAYRDANPEKESANRQNRRARLRNAQGSFTFKEWRAKVEQYKGRCHWCGKKIKGALHADHLIALAVGGSNGIGNIVPACAACNLRKSSKMPWDFMEGRLL